MKEYGRGHITQLKFYLFTAYEKRHPKLMQSVLFIIIRGFKKKRPTNLYMQELVDITSSKLSNSLLPIILLFHGKLKDIHTGYSPVVGQLSMIFQQKTIGSKKLRGKHSMT